jgi:hypothetical protein
MAKLTFPVSPDDILIELKVSGTFYKALSQTLLGYTQSLTDAEYIEIRQKIKDNKQASDLKQLTIMLLTSLVFSLEKSAEEQKLTKIVETEIPDDPNETKSTSES